MSYFHLPWKTNTQQFKPKCVYSRQKSLEVLVPQLQLCPHNLRFADCYRPLMSYHTSAHLLDVTQGLITLESCDHTLHLGT